MTNGATQEELDRAIAIIETDMITAMQSASERADRLSMFATFFGDPNLLNEQSDKYQSVTLAQVNEFARTRLGINNRASLLFVPRAERSDEVEDVEAAAA